VSTAKAAEAAIDISFFIIINLNELYNNVNVITLHPLKKYLLISLFLR
jgi:hypothetical protein